MKSIVYLGSCLFLLAGCATTAPQATALLNSPPSNIAPAVEIKSVPFVDQNAGHCGPATLTMAMQWAGRPVNVDQISPLVITPDKNGSLQEDMISASRREGMMGIRIEGMEALMKELDAGHPVIIFENLGLSWYQQWHYAIVVGYDLKKETFIMHSGHEAFESTDMKVFERSWKLSDYWALVVLNPGDLATAADELANMQAAAGLEQAGKNEEARKSYLSVLQRWPTSLGALVGLGNLAYKQNDFKSAVSYLRQAQKAHPDSQMVLHNLKVAEAATKESSDRARKATAADNLQK
jgi:hypothetical protein